jgi:hypothetical protein
MNAGAPMAEPSSRRTALPDLFEDIRKARIALRKARGVSVTIPAREAQQQLADAIGAYIEALEVRDLPVPYALRDEMRIYEGVLAPNPRPR